MACINQLDHITLICKNLNKTKKFLTEIFGAVEHYTNKKNIYSVSKERFFKIGSLWLVTMKGESVSKTYNHMAFRAKSADFPKLRQKIKKLGLEILPGRKRVTAEGGSIYFYDYDNHLFELHSGDLETRLIYYKTLDTKLKRSRKQRGF